MPIERPKFLKKIFWEMLMHLIMGRIISPVYVSGAYWADPVRYKPNFWPVFYFSFFFFNDKQFFFFF